jgi:endonuclease/exonuclease/phosphatase family metal-dependent hydrolase
MPNPSRRSLLVLALLAAVLAACGGSGPASTARVGAPAINPVNAGRNKLVTVMSWNLYLGAELAPVLRATTQSELLAATTAAWQMVVRNDFRVRAAAVAEQIAAARPDLIGLQEAYTWRMGPTIGELRVVYDYVQILLDELVARGLRYRVAANATLTDVDAPILTSAAPPALAFVRGTDHEVILAREDVRTANPTAHVFSDLLKIAVLGQPEPLTIERGWASVDVNHEGIWFHFASTHLEAFHPYYRTLQARELARELAGEEQLVLVGDLNSDPLDPTAVDGVPNSAAYLTLAGSGLSDTWRALYPGEPGFTSPYPEDLTIPEIKFDERIDHVLFRGAITPRAMAVAGAEASERVCGVNLAEVEVCLWPSDHAGPWATLRLDNPRFLALTR